MKTMMTFAVSLALASAGFAAAPKGKTDPALVGSWGMNGEVVYAFRADGTVTTQGQIYKWSVQNGKLTLAGKGKPSEVAYKVRDNQLTIKLGWIPITLEKMGKISSSIVQTGKEASRESAAKSSGLSQMLLSSPWCSFSYNKVSGATHTKRVQFFNNGTWSDNARYEGYSSGDAGTFASQHDSGNDGRWKAEGEQLYMSGGNEELAPVNMQVNRNSNGTPILVVNGTEYSQCR